MRYYCEKPDDWITCFYWSFMPRFLIFSALTKKASKRVLSLMYIRLSLRVGSSIICCMQVNSGLLMMSSSLNSLENNCSSASWIY